jgi:hypothetical protein
MNKARAILAGGAVAALTALPAVLIPASASTGTAAPSTSSGSSPSSSASSSSGGPLVQVCVTVTPKSVAVGINGQNIVLGPAGVPRSCVATPF